MEIAGQIFPEIQCPCRAGACIVKTSWTERNPGRKFYSCPGDGMQGRRCNFFKWCDIASPLKRVESGTEPMDIDGQSSPEMQCTCGLGACIVQISWTEKNPGRKFYCCPGIQGRRCGFFMWCDIGSPVKRVILESESAELSTIQPMVNPCQAQLGDPRGNPVNHQSPPVAQKDMCFNCKEFGHWARDCSEKSKIKKEVPAVKSFDAQYFPEIECRCGAGSCILLTAGTEKNRGRKFYKCPGKDDKNCHFFEWYDSGKVYQNCDVPQSSRTMCSCGAGICRIEIVKDGKDVGRKVFVCPIKKGQGACSFYQLLDSSGKTASSICLEETNVFSPRSVPNAQEANNAIKELGGSKQEAMLPSGLPKKPLFEECDTKVETDRLGSGLLNSYFLPVESLRLNKCSSAESGAELEESIQSGKEKQSQKDHTGSPGASFFMRVKLPCILEFDGASKGNPGQAGAGAVIRAEDGIVCRLREGVGIATNNVAEYRALILGLKYALEKGFTQIRAQGDSQLVCKQVEGVWKTKDSNMIQLCNEAKELKDKFSSFQIYYIARSAHNDFDVEVEISILWWPMEFIHADANWEADAQANLAVHLADGEVQEVCDN
ncbi:uncharacterized protein LOC122079644 isoform X2 [Macadamia integrifolia]|uniref:uncharacterized protein LOC122079644 isoform X2 n=1 Tax=Macadamia integrifolia TaxID=60698 RepID=UPI001C4E3BF3|nr:uncharacterized protein LOC122079644 isoform X2 [Macadamia integrifolia]